MSSLVDKAIDGDTSVGAHCRAGGTPDAIIGDGRERKMVSAIVDLLGLQFQHIFRAGDDT